MQAIIVRLSVAFILFEGGLALQLSELKKVQKSVRRLISIGVIFTFLTASTAAHFIGGLEFRYAILFGSLVTVTGPTVIRPLVQRGKMRPELAAILEGGGGQKKSPAGCAAGPFMRLKWLRGWDLNPRPQGYEPCELPGCSTPQNEYITGGWTCQ